MKGIWPVKCSDPTVPISLFLRTKLTWGNFGKWPVKRKSKLKVVGLI